MYQYYESVLCEWKDGWVAGYICMNAYINTYSQICIWDLCMVQKVWRMDRGWIEPIGAVRQDEVEKMFSKMLLDNGLKANDWHHYMACV